jgi:hypothetical protein
MMLTPYRHLIESRVAAGLGAPPAVGTGQGVNGIANGGTLTIDTPTLVEHTFTADSPGRWAAAAAPAAISPGAGP